MAITKAPFISIIPYIENDQDDRTSIARLIIIVLVLLLVVVIGIVAVHNYYMPLDVLWYVLLRKLGIEIGG